MEQKELQYRGYRGSVEYSVEDGVFHGKLTGIRDLVLYEGDTLESLEKDFRDAVDDYLEEIDDRSVYDNAMAEHKKNLATHTIDEIEKELDEEDPNVKH